MASRSAVGTPLGSLPEGFEFAESVNGLVSVRKVRAEVIAPEELAEVRAALSAVPGCEIYRVAIQRDAIVIYAPSMWPDEFERLADEFPGGREDRALVERLRQVALRNAIYSPLVRFVLGDVALRTFCVERQYFSGDGGWLSVAWDKPLAEAVQITTKHLGSSYPKEEFFAWI